MTNCQDDISHLNSFNENAGIFLVQIIDLYPLCKFTNISEKYRLFSSKLYSVNSQKAKGLFLTLKYLFYTGYSVTLS
jgi:hypothetical protein